MHKVQFKGAEQLQKGEDEYGIKFNFTCLTCKNDFELETFDSKEAEKIAFALENDNDNNAIYCKKCLENQIKNN
jgi:hypothetical protein